MDREKVVNAVKTAFDVWIDEYTGCSWFKEDEVRQAKEDAIAMLKEQDDLGTELTNAVELIHKKNERIEKLLKEQEAVEPIPYHRSDGTIFKYECRQCRTKIFKMDLFCRHCGMPVKWE